MHNAKVPHDDRCRDRIGEVMVEDYDQRQVERVSSRTVPEVELPRPEAGEEMDVGESMVDLPQPVNQFPQFEWWIIELRNQAGLGSRANETNTDDREMKRVRVTERHDWMDCVNRTRLVESGGARDDRPCWNLGCAKQGGTIRADGTSPRSRRQEDVKQSS